jgi:hypothetical protein
MRAVVFVFLGACANAPATGDDAAAPIDSGPPDVTKLPIDAASDVIVADVFDAGCAQDAALGGIRMPAGSNASATTSYQSTAAMAIDGDEGTYWNAGDFTGSITVMFASPQTFDGVKLFVSALPATSETYTVFGIQDEQTSQLAQSTQTANEGGGALATIAVPNAAYDGIRVDVQGNASWVAINEIALATTYCP